jgi:hypothetical protein
LVICPEAEAYSMQAKSLTSSSFSLKAKRVTGAPSIIS